MTRSLKKRTWFLFSQKCMQRAKIERRFEACPISEFYIYYAEFMVIFGLLGILRRTLSSHWKGFHGSSAPKTFDHAQQARSLTTMFSSFEVHVFNRERCLQEFLIEAVERPPVSKVKFWKSAARLMQEWDEGTIVRVTRKLPQHNGLMSYWWRRGRHIVERTVRGAVVCKCWSKHTILSLTLLWSHVNDLGYEGKVAMVSWMEATESDIFKAEEILMARHTTLVLQKKSDQHIMALIMKLTPGLDLSTILMPWSPISRIQVVLWPESARPPILFTA